MDNPLRDQTGRVEPEEQILKVQFLIYTLGLHLKHELVLLLFFVFNPEVKRPGLEQLQYLVPRKHLKKIALVPTGQSLVILLFFYLGQLEYMLGTTRHQGR